MKILFIGGTGNISSECAALLHQRGDEIWVLTRGRSVVPPEYQTICGDRHEPATLRAALDRARPEVVINFLGFDLPDVQTDHALFHGAVGQYLFISSATVYAKPPRRLPLTEDAPLGNPAWDYAQKKLQCEQWLLQRRSEDGFPVTLVRPSHTYSKSWIPNVVSSAGYAFAARLERGAPVFVPDAGDNPWTLTAASDFAAGFSGLVGNAEAIGEAFHITSDEVLTWNTIYAEIAAAVGVTSSQIVKVPTDFICAVAPQIAGNLKGDKAHPGVFDNTKIKRFVPGFHCHKPFRAGIRESVAWLRAHPEQQNINPKVDIVSDQVLRAWQASRRS